MAVKPQTSQDVHAPFNFVPLSEHVFFPDWADQVSHDIPFKDGYCGEIEIELEAETPLLIGGEIEPKDHEAEDGETYSERKVKAIVDTEGNCIVPGSSLKGMVRNVLEIASFSKMKMVDDGRFSVRDLSSGAKFYSNKFTRSDKDDRNKKYATPHAGWLYLEGGSWKLQPCEYARIEASQLKCLDHKAEEPEAESQALKILQAELQEILDALKNPSTPAGDKAGLRARRDHKIRKIADEKKLTQVGASENQPSADDEGDATLEELYEKVSSLLNDRNQIYVQDICEKEFPLPHNKNIKVINRMCSLSTSENGEAAYLVITGQVSRKTKEFVFFPADGEVINLSEHVIEKFQQVYTEKLHPQERAKELDGAKKDAPWGYWWRKLSGGEVGPGTDGMPGVPVFYLKEGAEITSLGLSLMYKLPYDNSVHDMIKNSAAEHFSNKVDLSELIFGRVSDDAAESLASRVSFGHAIPVGNPKPVGKLLRTVLASPNPQYYPVYVNQKVDANGYLLNRRVVNNKSQHSYLTYMKEGTPRIRGWKRYLPHGLNPDAGDAKGPAVSHLEPLEVGARFRSKITFHNLTKAEVGGLLWSLCLGGNNATPANVVHGLGLGKAIGLGQVSIVVRSLKYRQNGTREKISQDRKADTVAFTAEFERVMNDFLCGGCEAAAKTEDTWQKSAQIQSLMMMGSKSIEADAKLRLQYMKIEFGGRGQNQFVNAKNDGKALPKVLDRVQEKES